MELASILVAYIGKNSQIVMVLIFIRKVWIETSYVPRNYPLEIGHFLWNILIMFGKDWRKLGVSVIKFLSMKSKQNDAI